MVYKEPIYVYFFKSVLDESYIKIGMSNNYKKRHEHMSAHNPLGLKIFAVIHIPFLCWNLESFFHKRYSKERLNNEWFYIEKLSILDIKNALKEFLLEKSNDIIPDKYFFNKKLLKHERHVISNLFDFVKVNTNKKNGFILLEVNKIIMKEYPFESYKKCDKIKL